MREALARPVSGCDDDAAPRVVVVGSGAAGLTAALRAVAGGARVTVVTKSALTETATDRAQGGIAAMTRELPGGQPEDTAELHVRDTLAAGAGCCDPEVVRGVVRDSSAAVTALTALGVQFDRVAGPDSPWVQGLEGAHSVPRILHAGGDATGHAMQSALADAARATATRGDMTLLEYTLVTGVERSHGAVVGVTVRDVDPDGLLGPSRTLAADHVVLATGGAGQLYPFTTNPAVATGDGIALALRAGADVRGMEFLQFHPTALAAPGSFLISEAVRGEGAVLRNHRGERFMLRVDPRAELAPRDVVARAIAAERSSEPGSGVFLDCTTIPVPEGLTRAEFLTRRFPTIDRALREHGIEWSRDPVPVSPAAHYLMGGIATDTSGRTSIPGLWAAGECAATGLHGANRLASNSLLEAVVFGERIGALVSAREPGSNGTDPFSGSPWTDPGNPSEEDGGTGAATPTRLIAYASPVPPEAPPFRRSALQAAMWRGAGVVRTDTELARTQGLVEAWLVETWLAATSPAGGEDAPGTAGESQDHAGAAGDTGTSPGDGDGSGEITAPGTSPGARAPRTLAEHEDHNLLTVALELVRAARARTESCGAHHRADRDEAHERTAHAAPLSS